MYICIMKYTIIFLFLLCFGVPEAYSQILNGGFEDWANGNPIGWRYIPGFYDEISSLGQSPDAHSGKYSFSYHFANPYQTHNINYRAFLVNTNADGTGGFRIPKGKNFFLSFWYKAIYSSVGNGRVGLSVGSKSFEQGIDTATYWKKIPDIYISGSDSQHTDSLQLFFGIDADGAYKIDIQFYLDDIVLDSVTSGVALTINTNNTSFSIFPNPSSSHANLHYHLNGTSPIHASIFDLTGREVLKLPSLQSASDDGTIPFDCDALMNGLYYLRFDAGGTVIMRKIIVQH